MIVWKDTTSYSRWDDKRIPRTWKAELPCDARLIVTKHIDYGEEWTTSCYPLYDEIRPLGTEDLEEAKRKAMEMFVSETGSIVVARERVKMTLMQEEERV